jgi:hypothetical protein
MRMSIPAEYEPDAVGEAANIGVAETVNHAVKQPTMKHAVAFNLLLLCRDAS